MVSFQKQSSAANLEGLAVIDRNFDLQGLRRCGRLMGHIGSTRGAMIGADTTLLLKCASGLNSTQIF
jgi:hypothetical protein